jgi:hypothetical protein
MSISGGRFLLYSAHADADRAYLEALGVPAADTGRGWLVVSLPSSDHASDSQQPAQPPKSYLRENAAALFLICDDLQATVEYLRGKGVDFTEVVEAGWGMATTFELPSGTMVGLYEPIRAKALNRMAS